MKKELVGKNIAGEKRVYTFELMDTETGLEVFYKYSGKVLDNDMVRGALSEGIEGSVLELLRLVPAVLPWSDIKELAKKLMAGAETTLDNGDKVAHGEDGLADYMAGDPMELFGALLYAIWANYPKYIDPLLGAVSDDSNQDSTLEKTADSQ